MTGKEKIFHGAILMVAMRWTDKLIGIVSMIILARLLAPEDFGVVAMASLVVGLLDVILSLGVTQALVHNKDAQDEDYNTAWTIRLIQASCACILIFCSAPFAVEYFNNTDISAVLRVMAFSVLIGGFENIGIVTFQKEMQFDRDFKFMFIKRIIGFLVTISLAFILQTYWAMVFGAMVTRLTGVILSYAMHAFRPSLSLQKFSTIWSFSQWMLIKNVGAYLYRKFDQLLVGGKLDANVLGGYTLAKDISDLPSDELLAPLGRVLFPAFVEARDNPTQFSKRLSTAIGVQCMALWPACLGLIVVAEDTVLLLLGQKWLFVVPVLQVLAVGNLIKGISHAPGIALLAVGRVKYLAYTVWSQVFVFVIGAAIFWDTATVDTFAWMRVSSISFGALLLVSIVFRDIEFFTVGQFLKPIVRPLISSILMVMSVSMIGDMLVDLPSFLRLLLSIVAGVSAYAVSIGFLWLAAGKPEGAEEYILSKFFKRGKQWG